MNEKYSGHVDCCRRFKVTMLVYSLFAMFVLRSFVPNNTYDWI